MSLLLDALNKADQERKRNDASPSIHSTHENADNANRFNISTPILTIGVIALLAALLISVYWLGKLTQKTNNEQTTLENNHSQTNISKNTAEQNNSTPQNFTNINREKSHHSEPNTNLQNTIKTSDAPSTQNTDNNPDETVASLYQQKNSQPASTSPNLPNTQPVTTHNTTETTTPQNSDPLNSIDQFVNLPEIHDLPTQILTKIPSLNYSEHNFNNAGGSVKINGQIKHVNDQLATGVVIDKILEDGIILHVDTYIFKMRALNSWVNM